MALHLNKLESPQPKGALCQVYLKLAKWFLRRIFLNNVNVFPLFCKKTKIENLTTRMTTTTTKTTDKLWSEDLTWAFGRGELKMHVSVKFFSVSNIVFIYSCVFYRLKMYQICECTSIPSFNRYVCVTDLTIDKEELEFSY